MTDRLFRVAVGVALAFGSIRSVARAQLPTPDHVVIVIEENHSEQSILGNPNAGYINSLATAGATFSEFYAITHPSEPNYLQFFSGSNQGVVDDSTPANTPFSTPNLGAALIAAGRSFAGYSQSMPSAGFTGDSYTTISGQNQYVRKHNPWVNWQTSASPIPANQLAPSTNLPFSSFPANFAALPTVSIVVPDEQNDMHDGTIQQADNWLQSNLSGYATWAQTHNSLLVVTFDEDDHSQNNQIPTILYGPMVRNLQNNTNWNLHNLQRSIEDMYGTMHCGVSNNVAPIRDVWTTEANTPQARFVLQQGVDGYAGGHDTYIEAANPSTTHGSAATLVADGSPLSQGLVRFDNLNLPSGATIKYAKLTIFTGSNANDESGSAMSAHRMLGTWSESSTWASLVNGITADDAEASVIPDGTMTPVTGGLPITFDVTASVQAWADGDPNYGWVIIPSLSDGWRFNSDEFATPTARPMLEVVFVPEPLGLLPLALCAIVLKRWACSHDGRTG